MQEIIARNGTAAFVVLTFAISFVSGLTAFSVGGDQTFQSLPALPLLLIAIWAPNLAAIIVSAVEGRLGHFLAPLYSFSPSTMWVFALVPMGVAVYLGVKSDGNLQISPATWAILIGMNLIMGPLGEEMGWRGFFLPRLIPHLGTVGAALVVGIIWAVWHLPLWFLPSPQSQLSLPVFFVTVICFSVIMTGIWVATNGEIWPMVLFHLAANVGVGWLEVSKTLDASAAYRQGMPIYVGLAVASSIWLAWQTRNVCVVAQ